MGKYKFKTWHDMTDEEKENRKKKSRKFSDRAKLLDIMRKKREGK